MDDETCRDLDDVPRELSREELEKLENDRRCISEFQKYKLEKDAKKNWDLFYKRNKDHFFKDRHWTVREFQELVEGESSEQNDNGRKKILLEVGCGVGNFIFPLLESGNNYFIMACDFSPVAIDLLKSNPLCDETKCKAFVADITDSQSLLDQVKSFGCFESIDLISLIFVLSAISPEKMTQTAKNLFDILRPGGMVLFRDYGIYDHAMIRFSEGHKISENFYVRQDGTRAFYFTKRYIMDIFIENGFEMISNEYIRKETVNRKEGISVPRIFLQAKFRKPD